MAEKFDDLTQGKSPCPQRPVDRYKVDSARGSRITTVQSTIIGESSAFNSLIEIIKAIAGANAL